MQDRNLDTVISDSRVESGNWAVDTPGYDEYALQVVIVKHMSEHKSCAKVTGANVESICTA